MEDNVNQLFQLRHHLPLWKIGLLALTAIIINLAMLGAAVWVIVSALKWTGVLQ